MCTTKRLYKLKRKILKYVFSSLIAWPTVWILQSLKRQRCQLGFFKKILLNIFFLNHHFQRFFFFFIKIPLYQPASFCQTVWWSPYLTLPPRRMSRSDHTQQSTKGTPAQKRILDCTWTVCKRVYVCVFVYTLDVTSRWRVRRRGRTGTAGDEEGLALCLKSLSS